MAFLKPSFRIGVLNSLPDSGNTSMPHLAPSLSAVRLIIPKPMVRQRESIKYWRIGLEHVCSLIIRNGMGAYRWPNLLITTVIKKASKWLLLKYYMGGGVEPH